MSNGFEIQVAGYIIRREPSAGPPVYGDATTSITRPDDGEGLAPENYVEPLVDAGYSYTGEMLAEVIVGLCEMIADKGR